MDINLLILILEKRDKSGSF